MTNEKIKWHPAFAAALKLELKEYAAYLDFEEEHLLKDPLYSVIMDVLTKSNPNEILEVYKSMGIANLNEDNRAFLMEAVKKLEIDKKFREEGKEEGKLEGKIEGRIEAKLETAKAALKKGLSRDVIIDITGLDENQIEELEKEISKY